jgi:hypothetical protein
MDNEPSTSLEADKNATAMVDLWTKSLKYMPGFSYEKLEKHLVVDAKKTPDGKPAGAFKHKKKGYISCLNYPRQRNCILGPFCLTLLCHPVAFHLLV